MSDIYKNKYRIQTARYLDWDYTSNAPYFVTIYTHNHKSYFGEIINSDIKLSEIGTIANKFWLDIPNHFPYSELNEYVIMPNHIHGIITINKPENPVETRHALSNKNQNINPVETRHALSNKNQNINPVETTHALSDKNQNINPVETTHALSNKNQNIIPVETRHALSNKNQNINPVKTNHALSNKNQNIIPVETRHALSPQPHNRYRNPGKHSLSTIIGSYKSAVTKWCNENNISFKWQTRFFDRVIRNPDDFERIINYIVANPINWNKDKYNII